MIDLWVAWTPCGPFEAQILSTLDSESIPSP